MEEASGVAYDPWWRRFLARGPAVSLGTTLTIYAVNIFYAHQAPSFLSNATQDRILVSSAIGTFLYFFFSAALKDPGYVEDGYQPPREAVRHLPMCRVCLHLKPPRASHCRRCGKCVRRMDHHCPWINNCLGHNNEHVFFVFVLSSANVSFLCTFLISRILYHKSVFALSAIPGTFSLTSWPFWATFFTLDYAALSVGLILSSVTCFLTSQLFTVQTWQVLRNRTSIETILLESLSKAAEERKTPTICNPYDIGMWGNLGRLALPGWQSYLLATLVRLGMNILV